VASVPRTAKLSLASKRSETLPVVVPPKSE